MPGHVTDVIRLIPVIGFVLVLGFPIGIFPKKTVLLLLR